MATRTGHQGKGPSESLAVMGLQFIAGDPEVLDRFLSLSGITPQHLREVAQSPDFLSGILDFFLGDEPTLLAFAASAGVDPAEIAREHARLCGPMTGDFPE